MLVNNAPIFLFSLYNITYSFSEHLKKNHNYKLALRFQFQLLDFS